MVVEEEEVICIILARTLVLKGCIVSFYERWLGVTFRVLKIKIKKELLDSQAHLCTVCLRGSNVCV